MVLSKIWSVCDQEIIRIEKMRKNVEIHAYVVMPNHVHMIVVLGEWNHW